MPATCSSRPSESQNSVANNVALWSGIDRECPYYYAGLLLMCPVSPGPTHPDGGLEVRGPARVVAREARAPGAYNLSEEVVDR